LVHPILCNLFNLLAVVEALSERERATLFVQIVCNVLSTKIRYAQSMPRPLVPDACFKTSNKWRTLCQALVNAFGDGTVRWGHCKTTLSVKAPDGKKKAQYVPDPKRSRKLHASFLQIVRGIRERLGDPIKCPDAAISEGMRMFHNETIDSHFSSPPLLRLDTTPKTEGTASVRSTATATPTAPAPSEWGAVPGHFFSGRAHCDSTTDESSNSLSLSLGNSGCSDSNAESDRDTLNNPGGGLLAATNCNATQPQIVQTAFQSLQRPTTVPLASKSPAMFHSAAMDLPPRSPVPFGDALDRGHPNDAFLDSGIAFLRSADDAAPRMLAEDASTPTPFCSTSSASPCCFAADPQLEANYAVPPGPQPMFSVAGSGVIRPRPFEPTPMRSNALRPRFEGAVTPTLSGTVTPMATAWASTACCCCASGCPPKQSSADFLRSDDLNNIIPTALSQTIRDFQNGDQFAFRNPAQRVHRRMYSERTERRRLERSAALEARRLSVVEATNYAVHPMSAGLPLSDPNYARCRDGDRLRAESE